MYKNQASLDRLFATKRLQKRENCTHISIKKKSDNRSKPSLRKRKENNM